MTNQPTTIIEELVAAARGVAALLIGDRRATGYFDFSQRGLAGSFIAFLAATTFSAYLPVVTGSAPDSGTPTSRLLLMAAFLFAMQLGFSAFVLRQLNRLDGFIPYLVADNWATFFVTAISSVLGLLGLSGDVALLLVGIVVLVIEVNISRLIVKLGPWQIAIFLVAQLVGVSVGLIFIGLMFPLPPEMLPPPTGG